MKKFLRTNWLSLVLIVFIIFLALSMNDFYNHYVAIHEANAAVKMLEDSNEIYAGSKWFISKPMIFFNLLLLTSLGALVWNVYNTILKPEERE